MDITVSTDHTFQSHEAYEYINTEQAANESDT